VREILGAELERLADRVKREGRVARKTVERCVLCGHILAKKPRKSKLAKKS